MKTSRLLLAVALAATLAIPASAGSLSLLTGPQPASDMVATLNTLINNVNSSVAPAGAGSPSASITFPAVSSGVNKWQLSGSATGVPITATTYGTDTNISMDLYGKGAGVVALGAATDAASSVQVPTVASSVNFLKLSGAATAANPVILATGTDSTVGLQISPKSTGTIYLGGTTTANASAQVATVASAVNQIVITPTITSGTPSIAVGGSGADANAPLSIKANGTGLVLLGQTICTASGATPKTCNGQRGIVTTDSLSTAGATAATYVIDDSSVTASSLVDCKNQAYSGTYVTNGYPVIMECKPGTGTITVTIVNTHATNALAGTLAIGFTVLN